MSQLRRELDETRARLAEAEEALNAIRNGEVDGLIIGGIEGQQIFTLKGAQEPYRLLIEQMSEAAFTLLGKGTSSTPTRPWRGYFKLRWSALSARSSKPSLPEPHRGRPCRVHSRAAEPAHYTILYDEWRDIIRERYGIQALASGKRSPVEWALTQDNCLGSV